MNANEVIRRARIQFGEATASSVQDVTFEEWVNSAIKELYTHLPPSEFRPLIEETSISLSGGRGSIPDNVDQIVDVTEDGLSLLNVPLHTIRAIDAQKYFQPVQTVFASRDKDLWVRPTEVDDVDLVYISPPRDLVREPTNEFDKEGPDLSELGILPHWHIALVHLVTSYAYAQEEDLTQSQLYRGKYDSLVGRSTVAPPEAVAE